MTITSSIKVSRDADPVPDRESNPGAQALTAPSSPTESGSSAVSVSGPLSPIDEQLVADIRMLLQKVKRQNEYIRANYNSAHVDRDLFGTATITDTAAALVRLGLRKRGISI